MEGIYQIDSARSGIDNMSIDQAMLLQTAEDGIARLRIYRWDKPTVSLGYFQKFEDFQAFNPAEDLSVVRRATGGGAIVHHYDWTYSITLPAAQAGAVAHGASPRLYDSVHGAVIGWLGQHQVAAELWSNQPLPEVQQSSAVCNAGGCSFLCFERRHAGDVIVDNFKVMGSAQRRHGQALLQHGSLLLQTSPLATSLVGLAELGFQPEGQLEGFARHILEGLRVDFGIQFQCYDCSDPVVPIPEETRLKFESKQWTARI